ncbi:TolC family protein [Pedobacter frigidisoli]|uniref:TolC family protein n=1 Tax=Pedobacter frigidisoli TaxID=2530455 RepID=UPI00292ECA06|nr:TolC family protein [Pedobacter frigidisoli]
MENGILLDTTTVLDYNKRVEYRLLETQQKLLGINTSYNKLTYLPRLSGFINYSWNYLDDNFSSLYQNAYPGSIVGLRLTMPIFQGTKRIQEIRKAQLLEKRGELDLQESRNNINSQFERAMATYKAGLNDWKTAGSNVSLSRDVYKTIKLQYDEGIKTYLDLMTAESDLRTTQLYYLNALYNLLSAKLDVQQALGTINITP